MVGSTDSNTHILENSYMNTLDILEQFQSQDFFSESDQEELTLLFTVS